MRLASRSIDVIGSVAGLAILGPLMLAIAFLVRRGSAGPALYRARRVGRGGKVFAMLKFRTMVADADRVGPGITYRDDPRITPFGRWLRSTKLDELPQLVNVLRGEMTLVGPRPEAPEYVALYPPEYRHVVEDVTPGIFGLAQLAYRDEERSLSANVHEEYVAGAMMRKLAIDSAYVRRRDLWVDLGILARSAVALVRR